MALEPYQLYTNAPVNIGGSDGRVVSSDGSLTAVARESGEVHWFDTDYVAAEGNVPEPPKEQPAPQPTQAGSTTVAAVPLAPQPEAQTQGPQTLATPQPQSTGTDSSPSSEQPSASSDTAHPTDTSSEGVHTASDTAPSDSPNDSSGSRQQTA